MSRSTRLTSRIAAFAALALIALPSLSAQEISSTTPPVGYVRTELLGNSDTFTAPSLTRPPEFVGTVASAGAAEITVSGDPQWMPGTFVYAAGVQSNTYYIRIGAAPEGSSNPLEGRAFTIQSGADNLLTFDLTEAKQLEPGLTLDSIPGGTKIEIIPYWTIGTLFPAEDAGVSFEASPNIVSRKTEIYFINTAETGENPASKPPYYFNNGIWKQFGGGINDSYNDTVFDTKFPFKVRNSKAENLTFILTGSVPATTQAILLRTQLSSNQDNVLCSGMPIPVRLRDLGLIDSQAFKASPSIAFRADELFVYSNETAGLNKASSATYYYMNDAWRKFGGEILLDYGDVLVQPGERITIRKTKSVDGQPVCWKFGLEPR